MSAEVAALSLHDKLVADLKSFTENHDAAATIKHLADEADTPEEQGMVSLGFFGACWGLLLIAVGGA